MSKDETRLPPTAPPTTSTTPTRKVVAATAGAGLGVQAADFANWCVGSLWFTPDTVPGPVSAFIFGAVTAGFAFASGYVVAKAPGGVVVVTRIDGEYGLGAEKASKQVSHRFDGDSSGAPSRPRKKARPLRAVDLGLPEHDDVNKALGLGAQAHDTVLGGPHASRYDVSERSMFQGSNPVDYKEVYTKVDEAAAQKAQHRAEYHQQADERSDALGIATGALVSAKPLLEEMTSEKYEALNPRQRAAVDFNTMLATAVRKDTHRQEKYKRTVTEDMRGTYDDAVENMFGSDGGSDLYAPETMAVLRQLKVPDQKTADLDQYLNLQVAITEKDLKGIKTVEPIDVHVPDQEDFRHNIQEGLVNSTEGLQESLAKGNKLLQDFSHTAAAERHDDLGHLGGASPKAERVGLGWDTPSFHTVKNPNTGETWEAPDDMNSYFQQAFDRVTDVRNRGSRNEIIANIRSTINKPGEFDKFLAYVDQRTKNAKWYGAPLGGTEGVKYPSSDRARSVLGLSDLGGE